MKKYIISAMAVLMLLGSCAKEVQTGPNEGNKRFLDAWIQINHPELVGKAKFPGYYVLKDEQGAGELVGDAARTPYFRANFRITDLNGKITSSSYENDYYKLNNHTKTAYYGPQVFSRVENALYAGLDYGIADMNVGGRRQFLIPGWLVTTERFDTEKGYLDNITGDNGLYDIEITERIQDIVKWETDSLVNFMGRNYPNSSLDTTGFFRKVLKAHTGEPFSTDTTIYINYIGRRLDGMVFDTNIADTAKVYELYSESGSYVPVKVNWKQNSSTITMGDSGSEVIRGFSYLLGKMGPYEKAVGMFTSDLGYASYGSGSAIPSYSPLCFEVEIVDNE